MQKRKEIKDRGRGAKEKIAAAARASHSQPDPYARSAHRGNADALLARGGRRWVKRGTIAAPAPACPHSQHLSRGNAHPIEISGANSMSVQFF